MVWACTAILAHLSLLIIELLITAELIHKCTEASYLLKTNTSHFIGQGFILLKNDDPKHTVKTTKEFFKAKKKIFTCQVIHLTWIQLNMCSICWKRKLWQVAPQNKQELKMASVQAWQNITREHTQHLVMSLGHRLKAVIACKGYTTYYSQTTWIYRTLICPKHYSALKLEAT